MLMFGGGPHACLGKRFVTYELKAVLASMLRSFRLKLKSEVVRKNPRQVFFTARPLDPVIAQYEAVSI